MKGIKWVFLLGLVFSTVGCASVGPGLLQNTLADNPNISPQQLQTTLNTNPVIYNNVGSVNYQVYSVGLFGSQKAVYFNNGHFVTETPYDECTNLKMLLQLGAISQADSQRSKYKIPRMMMLMQQRKSKNSNSINSSKSSRMSSNNSRTFKQR